MKVLNREPAVIIAVFAALLQLVGAHLFHFSADTQGVIVAVVTAGFGVWTAFHLSQDSWLPAILGFAQALFSLFLAFGASVPAVDQANILGFVTVVVGLFVRTQVTAKAPPTA